MSSMSNLMYELPNQSGLMILGKYKISKLREKYESIVFNSPSGKRNLNNHCQHFIIRWQVLLFLCPVLLSFNFEFFTLFQIFSPLVVNSYITLMQGSHYVKRVEIRSFFRSVFSRIWTEYGKIRTRKNSVFGFFSRWVFTVLYTLLQ